MEVQITGGLWNYRFRTVQVYWGMMLSVGVQCESRATVIDEQLQSSKERVQLTYQLSWWVFISYWLIFTGYLCEKKVACAQRTLDGNCCLFPFNYKNTKYKSCTSHGDVNNRFWCATDYKYDKNHTAGWGYCKCKTLQSPRGVLVEILGGGGGACHSVLQILTLFQNKNVIFSHPFSDLASKIHSHFQTWVQFFEVRLAFNPGFFFLCSKAFSHIIFSAMFRVSNHQLEDKKN